MARNERDMFAGRLTAADQEVADAEAAYQANPKNYGFRLWALYGAPGRRRKLLAEMPDDVARDLGVRAERTAELARLDQARARSETGR